MGDSEGDFICLNNAELWRPRIIPALFFSAFPEFPPDTERS